MNGGRRSNSHYDTEAGMKTQSWIRKEKRNQRKCGRRKDESQWRGVHLEASVRGSVHESMGTMMFFWLCVLPPAGVPSAACSLPSHLTRPCNQNSSMGEAFIRSHQLLCHLQIHILFVCLFVWTDCVLKGWFTQYIRMFYPLHNSQNTEDESPARVENDKLIQLGWSN